MVLYVLAKMTNVRLAAKSLFDGFLQNSSPKETPLNLFFAKNSIHMSVPSLRKRTFPSVIVTNHSSSKSSSKAGTTSNKTETPSNHNYDGKTKPRPERGQLPPVVTGPIPVPDQDSITIRSDPIYESPVPENNQSASGTISEPMSTSTNALVYVIPLVLVIAVLYFGYVLYKNRSKRYQPTITLLSNVPKDFSSVKSGLASVKERFSPNTDVRQSTQSLESFQTIEFKPESMKEPYSTPYFGSAINSFAANFYGSGLPEEKSSNRDSNLTKKSRSSYARSFFRGLVSRKSADESSIFPPTRESNLAPTSKNLAQVRRETRESNLTPTSKNLAQVKRDQLSAKFFRNDDQYSDGDLASQG
jgi:hypothetical protein